MNSICNPYNLYVYLISYGNYLTRNYHTADNMPPLRFYLHFLPMQLHEDMRQAGFYIKTVEESCERFAVIDQEVVWYGNINLLAKDKVDDSIMRILSKEIASELMEISFGDNG